MTKSGPEYYVPPEAVITPTQENDRMQVRVQFKQTNEFPGYTYVDEFDHTAQSTQFLGETK